MLRGLLPNERISGMHHHDDTRDYGVGHSHAPPESEGHAHSHGGRGNSHSHQHVHTPEETKAVLARLSRAIGHLESVRRMVEDGRDCSEILIQLSAVRGAINNTGLIILQNHIEHCIVEAVASGDMETVSDLNDAIAKYLK